MPPDPPPSWGPADVLGPQAPVAPLLDRPAGLVGEPGPGVLDLSLPSDQSLFAAVRFDPLQQYGLIRDGRPDRIAATATKFADAGRSMDVSVQHSRAALGELSSAFTNDGAGVYDAQTHWGGLPPDYRDAGSRLAHLARRLVGVSDSLSGAQTSSATALDTLTSGLAATRTRWSGEVDAARGPGGLIPDDRIGELLARRARLTAQMQADTDTTGTQVHDLVEGYNDELRGLLTVFADSGHLPMTPGGPATGLQITPPAPTGPMAQIFPSWDGLPTLEGGYTPLPNLAPPPLINVPAPLGPNATDQGQVGGGLFPGPATGGVWYDRNSSGGGSGSTGESLPGAHIPGSSLRGIEDIYANPGLLSGKTPQEVESALGNQPGWNVESLGKGSHRGEGWVLRQYNERGYPTGPQIRWHPGGGHHGPDPYWRVVGPQGDVGGEIR